MISTLLTGELERFRESLPSSLTTSSAPLVHLAYWHVRLLKLRATPGSDPLEILESAKQGQAILAVSPVSPLTKDFATLSVVSLLEGLEKEGVKDEAGRELKLMLSSPSRPAGSWDPALRELVVKKVGGAQAAAAAAPSAAALTASQGLQHLADLATAGDTGREVVAERPEGVAAVQTSWDAAAITRNGFLSVLGEGR